MSKSACLRKLHAFGFLSAFIPVMYGQETRALSREDPTVLTSLSGTVVDIQGSRISGAHLSLVKQLLNPAETTSDSNGHFSLRNVKSGQYRLLVSANGFQNLTRPIDTAQDADKDLVLTLQIAPTLTTVTVQGE